MLKTWREIADYLWINTTTAKFLTKSWHLPVFKTEDGPITTVSALEFWLFHYTVMRLEKGKLGHFERLQLKTAINEMLNL